jgi:formylglycine-generating enzyme required for sulfatase activity
MPLAKSATLALLLTLATAAHAADTETLNLGNGQSIKFTLIKAGTFQMGSPEDEKGHRADEVQHEVRIADDFLIGVHPITRGQFARFVAATGYRTEAETGTSGGYGVAEGKLTQRREFTWKNPGFRQADDHPVVLITLKDANAFIGWVNQTSRRRASLPTEAQWEYACRAGTASRFYNGEDDADADAIAWYQDNSDPTTHSVGGKAANAWGLFDMSGHVFEWCRDTYGPYRPGDPVVGDMNQQRTVLRGGSFLRPIADIRSAARYRNAPTSRNADNGFRLVMAVSNSPVPPPGNRASTPSPSIPPTLERVEIENPTPTAAPTPPDSVPDFPPGPGVLAEAAHENDTFHALVGLACLLSPCAFILLVGGAIFAIVRRTRRNAPPVDPMQPIPVRPLTNTGAVNPALAPRPVQDGFWVNTTPYRAGDRVRYSYQGPGGIVEDEFVVEPGQAQFIYTGVTPAEIALMGLAQQAIENTQRNLSQRPPPIPRQQPRTSPPRRNYPSAY